MKKSTTPTQRTLQLSLAAFALLAGCHRSETSREALEAPQAQPTVVQSGGSDTLRVKAPQRFPLVRAISQQVTGTLAVTGSVSPDVSRELPVLSLANGRVVALHVGLGDTVRKGQLVMEVQSADVATAFASYLKSVSDERLAQTTLERDKLLYDKGAIAQSQLQVAENAEDDARAARVAGEQQLRLLGVDKDHPSDTVRVYAPVSGVVIAQNATAAGAAGVSYAGPSGSLTIADLSHVWVLCDVYENDLARIHLGQHADVQLTAFPGRTFSGTISDIGSALDPSLRTAKVRVQVPNPAGDLRIGMFATATLIGTRASPTVTVPSAAVLHLHDRAFIFTPLDANGTFRRIEIRPGASLPGDNIAVTSGLSEGAQVVANALDLQNTADQE